MQYNFDPNTTYTIRVTYNNLIHSSPADLDGVTLFRYREPASIPTDYTPKLSSRERTVSSALLFWDALPKGATARGYKLYRSTSATFDPSVTPTSLPSTAREHVVTGLSANTNYHFHLIADYATVNPVGNRTSPPAHHTFKTSRDAFRVIFDGETRAVAGGHETLRNDAAHTVNLGGKIEKKNPDGSWVAVPNTRFRLQLQNTDASEGAKLWNGTAYVSSPLEIETDATSRFSAKVLSSRKIGSATLGVQENAGTSEAPDWKDVGDRTLQFAMPESKRLFGIKEWNQTYANDTGWEFNPPFFATGENGTTQRDITCRIYLRFRKDTNESVVDRAYFLQGNTKRETLDANGDQLISKAEYDSMEANGKPWAPLLSKSGTTEQLWFPVNGHTLRVRLKSVDVPGENPVSYRLHTDGRPIFDAGSTIIPPASKTSKVVSFWDRVANSYLAGQSVANGVEVPVHRAQRPPLPEYIEVLTRTITTPQGNIEGVAEFSIRAGYLIHRATELQFSVEDVTVK